MWTIISIGLIVFSLLILLGRPKEEDREDLDNSKEIEKDAET